MSTSPMTEEQKAELGRLANQPPRAALWSEADLSKLTNGVKSLLQELSAQAATPTVEAIARVVYAVDPTQHYKNGPVPWEDIKAPKGSPMAGRKRIAWDIADALVAAFPALRSPATTPSIWVEGCFNDRTRAALRSLQEPATLQADSDRHLTRINDPFINWRCAKDNDLACPPEGCSMKDGCAREREPAGQEPRGQWREIATAPKGCVTESAGIRGDSEWFIGRVAAEFRAGRPAFIVIRRRGWPNDDSWNCAGDAYYVPRFFDAWQPLGRSPPGKQAEPREVLTTLEATLKELFDFLDTAPQKDLPVLNPPTVRRIQAVREKYEDEFLSDFAKNGGGCGFGG